MKGEGASTSKLTSAAVLFMLMLCCRSAASVAIHQSVEEWEPLACQYDVINILYRCIDDIISSIYNVSLKLDRECCDAMVEARFSCLINTRPFIAYKVDDYKKFCYKKYGIKSVSTTATLQLNQKQQLPAAAHQDADQAVPPSPSTAPVSVVRQEIHQCFSTIRSIEGCLEGVVQSFFTGRVQIIQPACCKAIIEVNDKCWPTIFPLNPFFPPVLKGYCSNFVKIDTDAATGPIPEGLDF